MRILIVEDDQFKLLQVKSFISSLLTNSVITVAKSVNAAMKHIRSEEWKLIVLDMSLPTYDITPDEAGGRPQVFGGREIIRYMDRLELSSKVIVVTQFEFFGEGDDAINISTLEKELKKKYKGIFHGIVYYSSASEQWKGSLREMLFEVKKSEY